MLSSSSVYLALRRPPLQRKNCEGGRVKLVFGFKAGVNFSASRLRSFVTDLCVQAL
jgi:hypothetical protein